MTYKGKKIGVPTLEMIREHIERKHIAADPEWVYNHYKDRHWKNAKGRPFRSLEIMIGGGANYFMHNRKPKPLYISPYEEQLKDYRWKAFRDFVFVARGKQCEMCGNKTYLQIHHPKYIHGRRAWEYNCNEVRVLCRDCHSKVHGLSN